MESQCGFLFSGGKVNVTFATRGTQVHYRRKFPRVFLNFPLIARGSLEAGNFSFSERFRYPLAAAGESCPKYR